MYELLSKFITFIRGNILGSNRIFKFYLKQQQEISRIVKLNYENQNI